MEPKLMAYDLTVLLVSRPIGTRSKVLIKRKPKPYSYGEAATWMLG